MNSTCMTTIFHLKQKISNNVKYIYTNYLRVFVQTTYTTICGLLVMVIFSNGRACVLHIALNCRWSILFRISQYLSFVSRPRQHPKDPQWIGHFMTSLFSLLRIECLSTRRQSLVKLWKPLRQTAYVQSKKNLMN